MATFSDYAKNILLVLLILQFTPVIFKAVKSQYSDLFEEKTRIGVITVKGFIGSASQTVKDIKTIFEDTRLKAIVLKVDSQGGSSAAAQAIFQELLYFKKQYPEKYVVTVVEQIAASGGYYIAVAGDYIITTPSALIGSVGVFISHPSFKGLIERLNISYEITKTGTYKGAGDPFLSMSPEQKAQFQELTNDTYRQFVRDVIKQRPQLPADSKLWAEGKIFTGEQALALKMIDAVGSPSEVENILRTKAHVVGKIEWVKPAKRRSFFTTLFHEEESEDGTNTYFESAVNTVCDVVEKRYAGNPTLL